MEGHMVDSWMNRLGTSPKCPEKAKRHILQASKLKIAITES